MHAAAHRTAVRSTASRWSQAVAIACCSLLAGPAVAQPADPDAAAAQAVVHAFHTALRQGDATTVLRLLAADAAILENGHVESRQAYLDQHLQADIEFARAVPTRVVASEATVSGHTAWVRSATLTQGRFRHRNIRLAGAELVVLTRSDSGWEIRAVHWSSHESR